MSAPGEKPPKIFIISSIFSSSLTSYIPGRFAAPLIWIFISAGPTRTTSFGCKFMSEELSP